MVRTRGLTDPALGSQPAGRSEEAVGRSRTQHRKREAGRQGGREARRRGDDSIGGSGWMVSL